MIRKNFVSVVAKQMDLDWDGNFFLTHLGWLDQNNLLI
jgi:hypothetical protein